MDVQVTLLAARQPKPLGCGASSSVGSLGVKDLMDLAVLTSAKQRRSQKFSKSDLVLLVEHYTKVMSSETGYKGNLSRARWTMFLGYSKLLVCSLAFS